MIEVDPNGGYLVPYEIRIRKPGLINRIKRRLGIKSGFEIRYPYKEILAIAETIIENNKPEVQNEISN